MGDSGKRRKMWKVKERERGGKGKKRKNRLGDEEEAV